MYFDISHCFVMIHYLTKNQNQLMYFFKKKRYSLKEGSDLKIYELGVEVFVENIISEPSATGFNFILLGKGSFYTQIV
jgi:Na+-driven multidrug efflux pump